MILDMAPGEAKAPLVQQAAPVLLKSNIPEEMAVLIA